MPKNLQSERRRRGSALMLYTLLLPFLLLMGGLAIDVTMIYIVQAQLQTAVDGAARGASRLLTTSANPTDIATEFLNANMPIGYWGSKNLVPTNISVTKTTSSNTIAVSATVTVPLIFLQLLGQNYSTVAASSVATEWNLTPCGITYPYGKAPALTSVVFNESQVMAGYGPTFVLPHGQIMSWYEDEHPINLGVYKVTVKTTSGTTTTDYSSSFTPFTGVLNAVSPTAPLPVGTTALTGDQAGTDLATWSSTYGYENQGRPMWPALFITDITTNPNDTSGDWQMGGTTGIPINGIYGSWKGAQRTVDYTKAPKGAPKNTPTITIEQDADPTTKYMWKGVPDTPPGGFPNCEGYCSEVVWNLDSLGLRPGHTYRMQFIIHDGDQNQDGGDSGQGCVIATY